MEKATKAGRFGTVKVLARIGTPSGRSLRFAIILNRMEIAKFLIENGANTHDPLITQALQNKAPHIRQSFQELLQSSKFRF